MKHSRFFFFFFLTIALYPNTSMGARGHKTVGTLNAVEETNQNLDGTYAARGTQLDPEGSCV